MGYHYEGHTPFVDRAAAILSIEDLLLIDMARRLVPLNRLSGLVAQAARPDQVDVPGSLLEAQKQLNVLRLATYAAELILAGASQALLPPPADTPIGYVSDPVEPARSGRPVDADDEPPANLIFEATEPEPATDPVARKRSRGPRE